MSVVFVVTPIIVGGWPVVAAAAAGAAAALGLRQLAGKSVTASREERVGVALEVDNIEAIADGVRADDRLVFGDGRIRITLERDARGKTRLHADGVGMTKGEIEQAGRSFLEGMIRQYAYEKVVTELSKKGFSITSEEVEADRKVRIRFRKSG
jgi:hypothetical protein